MEWQDLLPPGCTAVAGAHGWSASLPPGLTLLADATGEAAAVWLPVLAGAVAPAAGRLHCAGVCSVRDPAAYTSHVAWHAPHMLRTAQQDPQPVAAWLAAQQRRWPDWSDTGWAAHVQGFALAEHLGKAWWQLSTGTQRKLSLAAALASGARVTLIEEPVAALDGASIAYLSHALSGVCRAAAEHPTLPPRWVLVAHWEPLRGVAWTHVLEMPWPTGVAA